MKLQSAHIKNYKNISEAVIRVDGKSFIVTAPNGAGKTSTIQAFLSTLSGQGHPTEIIKKGESLAEVIVEVVDADDTYKVRALWSNNTGKVEGNITVHNSQGQKLGIKAFRQMLGTISFDVVENFLRRKKNEQIELLKTLSGKKRELDMLDVERKRVYEERTEVNRQVVTYEGKLKGQELGEMLSPIDTSAIYGKMNGLSEEIELYSKAERGVQERIDKMNDNASAIEGYRKKIEQLEAENISLAKEIEKGKAWLKGREKPALDQYSEQLKNAEEHNAKHRIQQALIGEHKALQSLKKNSKALTDKLQDIDREKAEILSNSQLPVEGLSFDDDGVYLDGLPFEEGQINTAKIYEVGFHIFRALGSNFRVMKLDMNAMDKDTFERIMDLAGDDIQIIFERVGWDVEEGVEIKFTEELL
jgi:uncharacterized protein related to proFAR isomerase